MVMRTTSERARRRGSLFLAAGAAALILAGAAAWALADRRAPAPPPRPCRVTEETMTTGAATPYPALLPVSSFVQGASLDLDRLPGTANLEAVLRTMRDTHHVNTVSPYGLSADRTAAFFAALKRLNMQVALRVEAYDPATFAFRAEDAGAVLADHREVLTHAARPGNREQVAYVMVNMPVDDPRVQQRLGGVNSALSRDRQVSYATTLTASLRSAAPGLRVFLGLFYGWDGSYAVPSYRPAGADGYVLTNYSYPGGDVSDIIGEKRLRSTVERAANEAGNNPIVVEYGFHTLTYQNGNVPDQVAGLVADENAKEAAMRATTRLYCDGYPTVIGTMYFGYNTDKVEGNPPRHLDYGLVRTAR
jgi:hypothetical protein